MAAEHVQGKIGYKFVDTGLLDSALTAAHRRDEQTPSFDGNRGLASLGISVIKMVHALYTVVVDNGTMRDININEHWFTTRKRQATACVKLGIDSFINQSIRQQHDKPSSTVLSNALTAIVGAVWLDLGASNESTSNACEEIFRVSCRIDSAITGMTSTADDGRSTAAAENDDIQHSMPGETFNPSTPNRSRDLLDTRTIHWSGEFQHGSLTSPRSTLVSPDDMEVEFDANWPIEAERHAQNISAPRFDPRTNGDVPEESRLPSLHAVVAQSEQRIHVNNEGIAGAGHMPSETSEISQRAVRAGKRKHLRDHPGILHNSSLHQRLVNEDLETFTSFSTSRGGNLQTLLDPEQIAQSGTNSSHTEKLRQLYKGILSRHSLNQFKGSIKIARTRPNASTSAIGPNLAPMERFREIRLHDRQEALSILLRRYHVAKLFETELEILRQDNEIIVETPSNFGTSRRPQAGNPTIMQEAALTDRVLYKVAPNLQGGTPEFKKTREDLKQLRRLARRLQILIKYYGFGILALLPSGPSYSELTITDRALITIPEGLFAQFSELLYEQHGIVLAGLSKAVEPALTALVNGTLDPETVFPIEYTEMNDFHGLSMGS